LRKFELNGEAKSYLLVMKTSMSKLSFQETKTFLSKFFAIFDRFFAADTITS